MEKWRAVFGVVVGIIFGALPGFTATVGIAILTPLTFMMPPESGLIMMGALFAGAMWGGSVSAILIPYFRGRSKKGIFASGEPDVL